MIEIFKEAMQPFEYNSFVSGNSSNPDTYPNNIEACCLAGHVCEFVKSKDAKSVIRGFCWNSKEEYTKMVDEYKAYQASPFIGFRFIVLTQENVDSRNSPKK